MDKYRGDLLKVLKSLDERLGGLEAHTDTLARTVGELHKAGVAGRQDTCERLKGLETTSADVGRKLKLLQDKMVRLLHPSPYSSNGLLVWVVRFALEMCAADRERGAGLKGVVC
jgi:hypothetical protein